MKTISTAVALFAVALVACSEQPVSPPSVPKFTAIRLWTATTSSREITSPIVVEELREFLSQPRSNWRINGRLVTPTVGDVALNLYSGPIEVEHVEFSDRRLLVGDLIADITPSEADRLLQITGLSRDAAFSSDGEKRAANKRVDPTPGTAPRKSGSHLKD